MKPYRTIVNENETNLQRRSDGAWIPFNEDNLDYQEYLILAQSAGGTSEITDIE